MRLIMNANELADALQETEPYYSTDYKLFDKAATMLRQQQNEIEDLINAHRFVQNFAEEQHQRAVALEMRELTDEEIDEVAQALIDDCSYCSLHFARAILRKAQEK